MSFSSAVINQRKKKGLTQEELAEKSGVSLRTIQRIEAGTVQARVATIRLIDKVLELPELTPDQHEAAESIVELSTQAQPKAHPHTQAKSENHGQSPARRLKEEKKSWRIWFAIAFVVLGIGLWSVWKYNQAPIDGVSGLMVKGDLETVRGFDWEETREIFEMNHPNFEITIGFEVDEPVYLNGSRFNNFKFEVKGKSKAFDELIDQYKENVNKLNTKNENQTTQPIDDLELD